MGQNKTIYPTQGVAMPASSSLFWPMVLPIMAFGRNSSTTSCQDEDKYHTPYACVPPPPCELDIYKVEVGECYLIIM
ncbi:MAG: hypothetical protein IPJ74_02970 [Saprospiraceae bacterium]|nr:hypothetical protein [Saprospiraceae bacterium]